MSPYDDGWLLEAELLERLSVEIQLNDPRTETIATRTSMTHYALVCSTCHLIVKRDEESLLPPVVELAPMHPAGRPTQAECRGSGKPAVWHLVADD